MPSPMTSLDCTLIPLPRPHYKGPSLLTKEALLGPSTSATSHMTLDTSVSLSYWVSFFPIKQFVVPLLFPVGRCDAEVREGRYHSWKGEENGSPERAGFLLEVNQQARGENLEVALGSHCQSWGCS